MMPDRVDLLIDHSDILPHERSTWKDELKELKNFQLWFRDAGTGGHDAPGDDNSAADDADSEAGATGSPGDDNSANDTDMGGNGDYLPRSSFYATPVTASQASSTTNTDRTLNAFGIAQEKQERFEEFYRPIEDEYLAGLFNPEKREEEVQENVGLVRQQFDNTVRALTQNNARYGQPTGDTADFINRKREIEQMLAETDTANNVRGLVYDRDLLGAQQMSAMARGLSADVSSYASVSDRLAAERKQAKEAADDAYTQAKVSGTVGGAVSGAMIGAKVGTSAGGPVGAIVGGVIGAVGGYLTS